MIYYFIFYICTNTQIIRIICLLIIILYYLYFSHSLLCEDHPINVNNYDNNTEDLDKQFFCSEYFEEKIEK